MKNNNDPIVNVQLTIKDADRLIYFLCYSKSHSREEKEEIQEFIGKIERAKTEDNG